MKMKMVLYKKYEVDDLILRDVTFITKILHGTVQWPKLLRHLNIDFGNAVLFFVLTDSYY